MTEAFWSQKQQAPKHKPDRFLYTETAEFVDDNTLVAVATTGTVNRLGEVLNGSVLRLDNYRKNPVVLWSHQWEILPIGRTVDLSIVGTALHNRIEFSPDHHSGRPLRQKATLLAADAGLQFQSGIGPLVVLRRLDFWRRFLSILSVITFWAIRWYLSGQSPTNPGQAG